VNALKLLFADAALTDILEQSDWYERQSGDALASRWENAVSTGIERIARNPLSSAPCDFGNDELHDIRRVSVDGFGKHSIFYEVGKAKIVILRVAHGSRDIESLF
jgi:plasmid stabilization system protein ParE